MFNLKKLSEAIAKVSGSRPGSASGGATKLQTFISKDKISLSFQGIHQIDLNGAVESPAVLKQCRKVTKLFLSHNHLCTLEGIEAFTNLTHLSLSHNKLQDIEELARIQNPSQLDCLAVKGNYIDRHPDYKALLLRYFPRLKELDGMQVNESLKQNLKDGEQLRRILMVFFYKMDQRLVKLTQQLDSIELDEDRVNLACAQMQDILADWAVLSELKDPRKL